MGVSNRIKRIISLILTAAFLCAILPQMSSEVYAAGRVYYNVDFSDAMLKSGVGQKIAKDCMFVSVVTMEAYMTGATSTADKNKVYNAVKNANPGSTSGEPNAEVIQSTNWGKTVGYESMKYSLENLYREVSRGNPVMIYRDGSTPHWSVVCGYTGSTTKLEESGFQMVNVSHSGVNKTNLKSWRNGKSIIGCRRRTFGVYITDFSGIKFCVDHPSIVQKKGDSFGAFGSVVSNNKLTDVTLTVSEVFTGKNILNKSVNPKAKYCNIKNSFDSSVTMAKWAEGDYYYTITAKDSAGNTGTYKKYFTIKSSYPSSAPKDPARTLTCVLNYSGKNYLYGTDFAKVDSGWYSSRNTSVATIAADSSNQHNGYNSLKITNKSAGSSGKDLSIKTMTNAQADKNSNGGDSKKMILSFWAKSSAAGTKLYFRWGYESSYRNVSLTAEWKKYTVVMDKTRTYGNYIHPYADKKGTVWIAEMQLEDGSSATEFAPENGGVYQTIDCLYTKNYTLPSSDPQRSGYTFDGWYTAVSGGTQITNVTAVYDGNISVFAHWNQNAAPTPTATVTPEPTSTATATPALTATATATPAPTATATATPAPTATATATPAPTATATATPAPTATAAATPAPTATAAATPEPTAAATATPAPAVTTTPPPAVTAEPEDEPALRYTYTYEPSCTLALEHAFTTDGVVSSNYMIESVTVEVTDSSGKVMFGKTAEPKSREFSLYSVDGDMKFKSLSAGSYTFRVTATDTHGTDTWEEPFTIKKSDIKISNLSYPKDGINKGENFTCKGTFTSGSNISNVSITVTTTLGTVILSAEASPAAASYDIGKLADDLHFEDLEAGKYILRISATDSAGTVVYPVTYSFNVKGDSTAADTREEGAAVSFMYKTYGELKKLITDLDVTEVLDGGDWKAYGTIKDYAEVYFTFCRTKSESEDAYPTIMMYKDTKGQGLHIAGGIYTGMTFEEIADLEGASGIVDKTPSELLWWDEYTDGYFMQYSPSELMLATIGFDSGDEWKSEDGVNAACIVYVPGL